MENKLNNAIYDITSFEWSSVREIADIISKYTNAKVFPGAVKGATRSITATKGKPYGWSAKIILDEGIKLMIEEAKVSLTKKY
jgi:nucleoside-diphosphate-sugar epimerase